MIVDRVVREHVEAAAFQWAQWKTLTEEDPIDQSAAKWVSDRLECHLDGIRIAGCNAWPFIIDAFETYPERGELFVTSFLALELQDDKRIQQAVSFAKFAVDGSIGLNGAFEWQPPDLTKHYVKEWIAEKEPIKAGAALAALIAHQYDPGEVLADLLLHPASKIRADACRLATVCDRQDLVGQLIVSMKDAQYEVRLAAAQALCTLGRNEGIDILKASVLTMGDKWTKTLRLLVTNVDRTGLDSWLAKLYRSTETQKIPIRAAGMIGDTTYDKWLIKHMESPHLANHAGKAFLELYPDARGEDLFSLEPQDFDADFTAFLIEASDPLPVASRFRTWLEQRDV
ncbi:hypothetical protein SLH49_21115 [Cognatiyoonia sp. IB215446]|uniref:hypothetical protein n=1 Tax=Cognatiyoonia sp. IB215446 TaxID=3097355 RepID=UPI002A1301C5|nr:hypothetical protein [Cognatiyoonia sp. IB215446]MDX8350498.1 hypothetical protein [Cognatiyoonia sp. IB215446]